MIRRGDVVMVDFPFTDDPRKKRRPALIVQNDRDNQKLRKTVIAMITGNLARLGDPSHVFVDPATPEGASSEFSGPSVVSCNNLYTIEQASIILKLGYLSDVLRQQVDHCLRAALELPSEPLSESSAN
jgi:mRNA interferase MazF